MANSVGSVQIDLEARLAKFESDIGRAARILEREMARGAAQAERAMQQMQQKVTRELEKIQQAGAQIGRAFVGWFSAQAIAGFAQGLARVADSYANIQAKVRLAAGEQTNLAEATQKVFAVAQNTFNSFESTTALVQRTALALRNAGKDASTAFTTGVQLAEVFNKSLVVSGASAIEAASSAMQFSQALASGKFQGDEFRSVMENNSRFAQLLADSLGVTTAKLREMSTAGKLNIESMLGVVRNTEKLDAEFAKMPVTISRATTQLSNAWTKFIGETDQAAGSSRAIAEAIQLLAGRLPALVDSVLRLTTVFVTYFAVFRVAPALYAASTAALAAYTAALTSSSIAAELGMTANAKFSLSMNTAEIAAASLTVKLQALSVLLFSGFVGWEIGSILREQFVEVRVAGIAMVEGLLVAWERFKEGAKIAAATIQAAFGNLDEVLGLSLKSLALGWAKFFDFVPAIPGGAQIAEGLRGIVSEMGPAINTSALLAGSVANIRLETELAIGAIRESTGALAEAELAGDKVATAHAKVAQSTAAAAQQMDTLTVKAPEQAKAVNSAESALNGYNDALARLENLADRSSKALGPLEKAESDHAMRVREIDAALQKAIDKSEEYFAETARQVPLADRVAAKLRMVAEARAKHAAAMGVEDDANKERIASAQKEIDVLSPLLQKLKDRTDNIGLSDRDLDIANQVRELRQEYSELTEAAKAANPPLEVMEATLRKQAGATYDAEKAAESWRNAWENVVDGVSRAIGDFATGQIRTWKDFTRSLVDTFKRAVADIISEWAKTAIMKSFAGGGGSIWGGLISAGAAMLGGSGKGTAGGETGGFTYGPQASSNPFSGNGMLLNYATNYAGGGGSMGSGSVPGFGGNVGSTMAFGGALMGAQYGMTRGDGGMGTLGSTAAGAIAGYWAGTVAAGAILGASAGAAAGGTAVAVSGAASGAMGAAAAVPVIGWIALIALVADYFSDGNVFGTKWRPSEHRSELSFSDEGATATSQIDEWRKQSQWSQAWGRVFTGGALLPSDWGDKDRRTRDLAVDPEVLEAIKKIHTDLQNTYEKAAQQLGIAVIPMLDATFDTITTYTEKGKVKTTKTVGTILGQMYEEPLDQFVKRMHAEAIIQSLDSIVKGASAAAEAYRKNADDLLDVAAMMTQAHLDQKEGNVLLGAGDSMEDIVAWVEKLRVGEEKLTDTYSRLQQASQAYFGILERANEALTAIKTPNTPLAQMRTALEQIDEQLAENIKGLNDAAIAAGLTAAKEEDLARIRELAAAQIDKIANDFFAGIDQQIEAMNTDHTPAGDFAMTMRAISRQMYDNIEAANMLARAQGRTGASTTQLARIHELAARQAAAAIRQLETIAQQQVRSLYGTAYTLADVDADIAELEGRAGAAAQAVQDFGSAMGDAASAASDAINLLLGDLSPLNDQQKLQTALGGLQAGTVSQEQVLQIGRRLYASTAQYNALFWQVMNMGSRAANGGGGSAAGQADPNTAKPLTSEEQERLAQLYERRDVLRAQGRLEEARQLADTIASLAAAKGLTFEEIAKELNFNLGDLAADLGLTNDGLLAYLAEIDVNADAVPDSITSNTDRLLARLDQYFGSGQWTDTGSESTGDESEKPGDISPNSSKEQRESLEPVTKEIELGRRASAVNTDRQVDSTDRTTEAIEGLRADIRRQDADNPRSTRYMVLRYER